MLGDIFSSFSNYLFDPSALMFLGIGILFGLVIGIIPGLGGNFVLAMLIPIIIWMEPNNALAFLVGAFAPTPTGGAITSILFGIPGTGTNAATTFDGFPMAQKGKAGRAIGAALTSSAIGGVFGALVLFALIPVLRPAVLAFAPPELFMMILLGIILIGSVGSGSIVKALISGFLGLAISMIGADVVTGQERYTFGSIYLSDGLALVPVMLGLFAITEMTSLLMKGGSLAGNNKVEIGKDVFEGVKDVFRHKLLFIRSSFIGTIVGIIPGLGGDVACFLAYGQAAQTSKDSSKFGKGAVEGVIAPEAANQAKEGGAFLPTLGFGLPGSSAMALFIGALMILGFTPGPAMLKEDADVLFYIVWLTALANVVASIFMFFLAGHFSKLTAIKGTILAPLVFVFAFLGAYSIHNSYIDVFVMILFGIIGLTMKQLDFSRPALIIGVILGGIAEKNLQLTLDLYGVAGLFTRPISLILFMLILLVLALPLIRKRKLNNQNIDRGGTM